MPIEIFKSRKEAEKKFPTEGAVAAAVLEILEKINNIDPNLAETDTSRVLRSRFFYWAGIPEDPKGKFMMSLLPSGAGVLTEDGITAFKVYLGEQHSVCFENRSLKKDTLVFKTWDFQKQNPDMFDLKSVIEGFIFFDAHKDEISDISHDTLARKMSIPVESEERANFNKLIEGFKKGSDAK